MIEERMLSPNISSALDTGLDLCGVVVVDNDGNPNRVGEGAREVKGDCGGGKSPVSPVVTIRWWRR
jgi:hypothetical protein